MPRKPRSDSVLAAVEAAKAAAAGDLAPPAHVRLRDCDMPFWTDIVQSRARNEWSKSDLVIGAQLARCQAEIEEQSRMLESEGATIFNARGTPVMNPRHTVVAQLAMRQLALMRALRMAGTARPGRAEDLVKQRENERRAREIQSALRGEGPGDTGIIGLEDLVA